MFEELSEKQLEEKLNEEPFLIVFFHTPFCGTCKLARKIIDTVLGAMNRKIDIASCDLNMMPSYAEPLEIMSVPALLFFENGELVHRIVAFGSLNELYYLLTEFADKKDKKD